MSPPSPAGVPPPAERQRGTNALAAAPWPRGGPTTPPVVHWREPAPEPFARAERRTTTILLGGLTVAQDRLVKAAMESLGYRVEVLDCPDAEAFRVGKEFGNRGQCNPTYYTVGNLLKRLLRMRDVECVPVHEILRRYVFFTAGACGPCRFGTYVTEYRKALRDAGFGGFRVLLFQPMGGVRQDAGPDAGLRIDLAFFRRILLALTAGDVLNAMGYRIRPYERMAGATDLALRGSVAILEAALRRGLSVLRALRRCRLLLQRIPVARGEAKPKVAVIGEFWAMTTEGDGNYGLQRFLEAEGAEVVVQAVTAWALYLLWQVRHDTRRRMQLPAEDGGRRGLAGRNPRWLLARAYAADVAVRLTFRAFAAAIGLRRRTLPDMDEIAGLARDYYDVELRGGEGHMEVGKLLHAVRHREADVVVSVKPFGCMPSSSVSDGIQSLVVRRHPEALFCSVETTGDGAALFQSRLQMVLCRARRQARVGGKEEERRRSAADQS